MGEVVVIAAGVVVGVLVLVFWRAIVALLGLALAVGFLALLVGPGPAVVGSVVVVGGTIGLAYGAMWWDDRPVVQERRARQAEAKARKEGGGIGG